MEISKLLAEKAKKEEALKRLQQELLASEKKIKRIHSEEKILEEKSRFKKIIAAGKLFEKAGILDDYDKGQILKLFAWYKSHKGDKQTGTI